MRLVMPRLDVILDAAIMPESAGETAQEMTPSGVHPLPHCRKKKAAASR
jgi:hypothetical protein